MAAVARLREVEDAVVRAQPSKASAPLFFFFFSKKDGAHARLACRHASRSTQEPTDE